MVAPVCWLPPCDPSRGEAARRYNAAHHDAYNAYWRDHPESNHGQRNDYAHEECKRQGITPRAAVVAIPAGNLADIPARLRAIADQIEAGDYGEAQKLAWVIDCGNGRIDVGLLGHASAIGPELHLLLTTGALTIAHGGVRWE
jgi:hypothetical protein